jgi:sugar phosphate isomerase/epimerase
MFALNKTIPHILAMPNFIREPDQLKRFAMENGFSGIDWSFDLSRLPVSPMEESTWADIQKNFAPLEIRYHCPFARVDIGHEDPDVQKKSVALFKKIIRLVSKAGGKYLTIHVGLGHDSMNILSWEATVRNLRDIVGFGSQSGVVVCLENLAWGWTSRPNLFEKLIRRTGAAVTLDIGHAHACESVVTQQYTVRDFISPHSHRVMNAHIYHTEHGEFGHVPPKRYEDISDRLKLLANTGCAWWVIELREEKALLATKPLVEKFFTEYGFEDTDRPGIPESSVIQGPASKSSPAEFPEFRYR